MNKNIMLSMLNPRFRMSLQKRLQKEISDSKNACKKKFLTLHRY